MENNEEKLSLREYMLKGYKGDLEVLFENPEAVYYAEEWDANVFVKKYLNKELSAVRKKDVRAVFKYIVRKAELEVKEYTDSEESYINNDSLLIKGGVRKLNLKYNDNFEIDTSDEF
ncbi:MAG: hypothetical protein IKF36_03185 [Bacilli bacterium]|nr:hypothetical protein [Bacilli bacterium]